MLEFNTPLASDNKNVTNVIINEETSDFTEDENNQLGKDYRSNKNNKNVKKHVHKYPPTEEEKCGITDSAGLDKDKFSYKFKKIHIPDEIIHKEILSNANGSPKQTKDKKITQNLVNSTDNDFVIQKTITRRRSDTPSRPQRISEVCKYFL